MYVGNITCIAVESRGKKLVGGYIYYVGTRTFVINVLLLCFYDVTLLNP